MSAYAPFSDIGAKVLHAAVAGVGEALDGGTLAPENIMIMCEDRVSHFCVSH
jgi:hypothetical protein